MVGKMTLEEKVGQLFIVRTKNLGCDTSVEPNFAQTYKNYPLGGIILFADNIIDPGQLNKFINDFNDCSEIPMFISVDEEGGRVARLGKNPAFNLKTYENAQSVGSSNNKKDAYNMGSTIGAYLKKYGFNMDFAPCADIFTNPDNTVIGDRAFSTNAKSASKLASAMADGLKEQNIIPVFKHFPGHGDTAEDSHKGIAVSYKTYNQMKKCEWLPYKNLSEIDCVMVGHIAIPKITNNLVPASLSKEIVTDILRDDLKFDGLVITDSLEMGAVVNDYSAEEACVLAIQAGCDILLDVKDFKSCFDAVKKAVENGEISQERLDESVKRILFFKKSYGIIK